MNLPQRVYDLSQPVFANCPQYPDRNPRPVQVRLLYVLAVQGVNKEILELSTHSGTHCDAPFHFFDDGATIDQVPLETYIAPGLVIDLRHKAAGSAIMPSDLEPHERALTPGDVALLNTGNGRRRANDRGFLAEYPYLSGEAAQRLVALGVRGVGIDAVSLGGYDDPAKAGPAHRAMLGNGKFIVEDLYFPDAVNDGVKRLFVAAPVKLQGCGGAWTRAMLWEYGPVSGT